eukprot:gene3292-3776_t
MSGKQEKSTDKGFLSRTATYTTKRARRAQEKFMQKVGKSDETKDEVFDEFVSNFTKQQASQVINLYRSTFLFLAKAAVARLQKELKQYLQCVASMQIASNAFAEAVKEVYEPEWADSDKLNNLFKELDLNFITLTTRLGDEVLEPMDSYLRPFSDVKTKISKRGRKRVDYDHCRHVVDVSTVELFYDSNIQESGELTLRAKGMAKSGDAKKLTQAEEEFQKAKSVFVELTSELYDELPALYDSRIGFYVSCFQSVFTLEGVFHRENARIQNQLNDLMDQLIRDVSAGTYSTKKSFAVARDDDQDVSSIDPIEPKSSEGGLATFYDVAVPIDDENEENNDNDAIINGETEKSEEQSPPCVQNLPPVPSRPAPQRPSTASPTQPVNTEETAQQKNEETSAIYDEVENIHEAQQDAPNLESHADEDEEFESQNEVVVYKVPNNVENPHNLNLLVPQSIFKVIATHKYEAVDDDEISFEKDEVIHVIPFEDPDEQDDGWLMGILDAGGTKGVFPENFTKRMKQVSQGRKEAKEMGRLSVC